MRNLLARVPRANAEMVAAAVRTIFAQPDAAAVADQFGRITTMLEGRFPDLATALCETREDLLAFSAFPLEHWRKIWRPIPTRRVAGLGAPLPVRDLHGPAAPPRPGQGRCSVTHEATTRQLSPR